MEMSNETGSFRFRRLGPGLLHCLREHRFRGRVVVTDVSGPFWLLALASVDEGNVAVVRGNDRLAVSADRYGVLLPPYAIVQWEFLALRQRCEILISDIALPGLQPHEPILFAAPDSPFPTSIRSAAAFMRGARDVMPIGRCPRPSPVSRRAKAALDAGFHRNESIATLAAKIGVSHAALTRGFRRDHGIAPAKYRSAVRVIAAALSLLRGEEIAETAFRVGFGDLGRFYKQFRSRTGATPARYRVR